MLKDRNTLYERILEIVRNESQAEACGYQICTGGCAKFIPPKTRFGLKGG
jgi:hypothetical protein